MLFSSYIFIFGFLPLALAGFHLLCGLGRGPAAAWLVLASVAFYAWWNPLFVIMLAVSIGFNFAAAGAIGASARRPRLQKAILTAAIAANLGALVYYKYLASIMQAATGLGLIDVATPDIVLPLGISFFTFTQIGYLVDIKQDVAKDRGILNYVLFVTFFPHLIAGPILHNREVMPQFGDGATYRFSTENLAVGLSIFVIGLAKKCLLADPLSVSVASGYAATTDLPLFAAWNAALCYSLQLYFDFSGYSDMAIGLARMFNVRFPLNFNSPYKATSIIEHWQRWHMTLSRYLALYVYNPIALAVTRRRADRGLGIGRSAQATFGGFAAMVMFPTLVTMGLAGVWHGAGLQFLVFGLLHGAYLTINHALRIVIKRAPGRHDTSVLVSRAKVLVTYLAVLVASVFFRADSVGSALSMLGAMIGLHGIGAPPPPGFVLRELDGLGMAPVAQGIVVLSAGEWLGLAGHMAWMICLYGIVWGLPNTQQIMHRFSPTIGRVLPGPLQHLAWAPSRGWAVALGVAAAAGVLAIGGTSEFLYFQF
jgi:D-alanyl-lipoteichoic acid acyltransferase DltB (MBOAT superfamily)